jgi:ubiquinone/menaquinone biosynthesis C-methylase UbiE
MSLVEKVVAQFARPTGLWGHIAGCIMAHRPSNRERNAWAIALLHLQPSDRVLEIGFGPGVAIQKMSAMVIHGVIWGIDHSAVMFRQASKRNQRAIAAGRVRLVRTSVSQLPAFDGPLDKILDVNGFQFWDNKTDVLRRLREQLRAGGIITLVHQFTSPETLALQKMMRLQQEKGSHALWKWLDLKTSKCNGRG